MKGEEKLCPSKTDRNPGDPWNLYQRYKGIHMGEPRNQIPGGACLCCPGNPAPTGEAN